MQMIQNRFKTHIPPIRLYTFEYPNIQIEFIEMFRMETFTQVVHLQNLRSYRTVNKLRPAFATLKKFSSTNELQTAVYLLWDSCVSHKRIKYFFCKLKK